MRWVGKLEQALLTAGLLMLGIYVGARIHGIVLSQVAVKRFESQRLVVQKQAAGMNAAVNAPDSTLWSPNRIKGYQESLAAHFSPAIAVLRVPKIRLEVPVLEGTDELTLNRAVGLIAGTARPEVGGNIGIAGHRDGFFRGLKDVREGDRIELVTPRGTENYTIDRIATVNPDDVSVLAPRSKPSITLVTCFPFYFVGSAPQRYIVQASIIEADPQKQNDGEQPATDARSPGTLSKSSLPPESGHGEEQASDQNRK